MPDINIQGSVAHTLAKYRNHLEFTGYNVEDVGEDAIFSRHPRKPNLWLKQVGDRGVLVSILYNAKENVRRSNFLEFLNALNAEFLFMKAYLNDEGTLRLETFFEGDYDRTNFSILIENIDFDMNVLFNHELLEVYVR